MRILAVALIVLGILTAAGGIYVVPGVLMLGVGAWLYDKQPEGSSETVAGITLVLGGLGTLAVLAQYLLQFTAGL